MSERGMQALRAEREEVLKLAKSLTTDEWQLPSDCEGWRVQDVIVHMADGLRMVVDPGNVPEGIPGDIEAAMSKRVEARREWTHDKVLAEYETVSAAALEALQGLQAPGVGETQIPIENLGSYPMHMLANTFTFDHFCHLRNDLLKPNGPLDREPAPVDELRVAATLEWLIAGLPQMAPDAMRTAITTPIGLRLTGPGGGEWTITPANGDGLVDVSEGVSGDVATVISSPATDFILWGTHRRPWRDRDVKIEGDESYATSVLDAIHVF